MSNDTERHTGGVADRWGRPGEASKDHRQGQTKRRATQCEQGAEKEDNGEEEGSEERVG